MSSRPSPDAIDIASLRTEYRQRTLSEQEVDRDPFRQFASWLQQAISASAMEPNAMALATCTPDGTPSVRMVLLKGLDDRGFVFFTNYESRKAQEMETTGKASLLFFWPELERQVRVEGTIERTSAEESDAYFASRPLESRIGAAASPQSQVIESRELLEQKMREIARQYPGGNIPRPSNWGGYRLIPQRIEFWQGRPGRLHDRIEYMHEANEWKIRRLAP